MLSETIVAESDLVLPGGSLERRILPPFAKIKQPSELWELERWLAERRREIDSKLRLPLPVLPLVFAILLRNGNLTENDLHGIAQDKLEAIRSMAPQQENDRSQSCGRPGCFRTARVTGTARKGFIPRYFSAFSR